MGVAHVALELRSWDEGGHRVDDHDVEGAGADEHVGDLERLLPRVRLGDQQLVDVDPERLCVHGVEGMLGIDEGGDTAVALGLGHDMERQGRLAGALRAEDLDDTTTRQAADAKSQIESQCPGRDGLDVADAAVAQLHDGALAELPLDLGHRHLEGLVPIDVVGAHWIPPTGSISLSTTVSLGCDMNATHETTRCDSARIIGERLFDVEDLVSG